MPVYNGARFLRRAIDSVLAQALSDLELIVVDDASTDDSAAVISGYSDRRIRVIRNQRNVGLAATLNIGLANAKGRFIARLDQDDVAHADRLATQVRWLTDHPHAALVGSLARLIDENERAIGNVDRPISSFGIRWLLLIENPFIHSSVMFRRDAATTLGGYSEAQALAEDLEFWGRFVQRYEVGNLDRALIDYRQWSASMMSSVAGDPQGRKQAQLRRTMAALIRRHSANEFGGEPWSESDADLLAGFTVGIDVARLDQFMRLFSELRARFERKWPAATATADYWRTLARQYDTIAFRATPSSRAVSFSVYAHAARHAPRTLPHFPWGRAISLVVLGKQGRSAMGKVMPVRPQ